MWALAQSGKTCQLPTDPRSYGGLIADNPVIRGGTARLPYLRRVHALLGQPVVDFNPSHTLRN